MDVENYVDTMLEEVEGNDESFASEFQNHQEGEQQQQTQEFDQQQQQQEQSFDDTMRQEIEQSQRQFEGNNKQQQPPKQKGEQQQQQLRPLGDGTFTNNRGDIVDEQGAVIARGGFARRMYEQNQRNTVRLQEQDREIHQLRLQAAERSALQTAANNYGLGTDELAQAIDFAGRVKRGGIVDVAKDIVALAVAAGHNVTEILGSEVGDSVDMRALRQMIGEVTMPIQQQQQQAQRQQQIENNARSRYNEFIAKHEFAQVHENDIAQLAQAQGIDATQAYYALREFCIQHRLDFSQPIQPQVQARAQQQQLQQNQRNQQQNQQQHRRRPLPNGHNSANMDTVVPEASHNASWAEIINSTL